MKSIIVSLMVCLALYASCSKSNDDPTPEPNPDSDIVYTADYDDGSEIFINVKIAIDKKGWEAKGEKFMKEKLAEQWAQINTRFNTCGQVGGVKLARHYTFKPDLDDIIVYDGCSYWGETGADTKVLRKMDKKYFKLAVIYDFFYEGEEKGEYGGGCGDDNGIGTILVINASDYAKNKYNDNFDQYTYRAITHELGHFRGVIDLYAEVIDASQNPVNHEGYMPIHCLMNDMTYTPDAESRWSDYAIKIINKAGNQKIPGMINQYVYDDFADKLSFKATKDGTPADARITLYPQTGGYQNSISSSPQSSFTLKDGIYTTDARKLFFNSTEQLWDRTAIFLVEAEFDGNKLHTWLPDYLVHDAGMDGQDTYEISFEF